MNWKGSDDTNGLAINIRFKHCRRDTDGTDPSTFSYLDHWRYLFLLSLLEILFGRYEKVISGKSGERNISRLSHTLSSTTQINSIKAQNLLLFHLIRNEYHPYNNPIKHLPLWCWREGQNERQPQTENEKSIKLKWCWTYAPHYTGREDGRRDVI